MNGWGGNYAVSYQYLIHRINELSEEDRLALTEQLIQEVTKNPEASTEQYAIELLSNYTEAAGERFEQFGGWWDDRDCR